MSKLRNLNREFISNLKTHELITEAKRNLILSILKSTTTNREAKNYLNKYQNQFEFDLSFKNVVKNKHPEDNALSKRDNQRELFIQRYLNYQNPFLNIYADNEKIKKIPLRLALIKIKFPSISSEEWNGIAETLKRLVNLGISPVILLDYDHLENGTFKYNELYMINQVNKVMNYLGKPDDENGLKTTVLRSLFSRKDENASPTINSLESILIPLYQGIIPIIQPVVYNSKSSFQEFISTNDLLYGLTSSLLQDTSNLLSIEKIVNIDPIGGIPSIERNQTSHVFINLSQEYSDIVSELYIGYIHPKVRDLHISNLASMNEILQLAHTKTGTDDTTGIITTPKVMSINDDQLNPIIYNVLTDRPIISSSLPSSNTRTPQLSTSIVKRGIEVKVYDADTFPGNFTMENLINEGLVDKEKLVWLINDSFGKKLGVEKYLNRINESLATLVIIGDYDGAAIITWEYSNQQKVAYLDKFAIARRNQGLPGMADIIFKIILQSHPFELIWRSRKNNPVNKWYFERCVGSMSTPQSQWKIFYTGELFNKKIDKTKKKIIPEGTVGIRRKLTQYSDICESIPPSFP